MWNWIADLVLMTTLLVLSIWDIRRREIPVLSIWFLCGLGLPAFFLRPGILWADRLYQLPMAFLPGSMALLVGELTGEKVGKGDGWLLVAMGFYLNAGQIYIIMLIGFGLGSAMGLLLSLRKGCKEAEIPLIPFLLVGYCIVRWFLS